MTNHPKFTESHDSAARKSSSRTAKGSRKRKINTAYEAFWFLNDHPKMRLRERHEVGEAEAKELKRRGFIITMDKGGTFYREHRHCHRKAMGLQSRHLLPQE
jgi:hypothetical protein